jgi:hypothetical protein
MVACCYVQVFENMSFGNAESKVGGRNFWVCLAQTPMFTAVPHEVKN